MLNIKLFMETVGREATPVKLLFQSWRSYRQCEMVLSVNFSDVQLDGHVRSFIFLGVRSPVRRELLGQERGLFRRPGELLLESDGPCPALPCPC